MKTFISILSIIALIAATIFVFAACGLLHTEHSLTKVEAKAATCTEAGAKEYYVCSECEKMFADAEGTQEIDAPEAIDPLGHSYGTEYITDENGHWYACACGAKSGEASHADAEPNKDHKCDTCGYEMSACADGDDADHKCDYCGKDGITQCSFGEAWVTDETNHWNECACGAKSDEAAHADAEPNKDHKCDTCGYEMSVCADGNDADHKCDYCGKDGITQCSFGEAWVTDETNHWHECACGAKSEEAAHVDESNKDHKCDVCGYKMSECSFSESWIADESKHYRVCVCGAKSEEAAHVDESNKDHKCDICGHTMSVCADGNDADHKCDYCNSDEKLTQCSFGEYWVSNAEKHWHECACGAKSEETAHNPDREAATEEFPILCTDCGYIIAPVLKHTHKFTVLTKYDDNSHCMKCSGCNEIDSDSITDHVFTENVDPSTCNKMGTKTYTCECGFSKEEKLPIADHTPAAAVRENEKPATCKVEGSYEEVIYCSVCGAELSREAKVIGIIAHTAEELPRKEPTCAETGLEVGTKCKVCGDILVPQAVIPKADHTPADKAKVENEKPATCIAEGSYEEVIYCSECGAELSRVTKTIGVVDHSYGEAIEGPDGFYKACQTEGCTDTIATDVPVKDYKAVVNNSFTSTKANSHKFMYTQYGAYGVFTNGAFKVEVAQGSPETGGIGDLDRAGKYVKYEFALDKPGTVDIVWNVAGTRFKFDVDGNLGITNLAGCGKITIDGKEININGVSLPAGSGTGMGTSVWWNLNQIVISGVALDAGTHTFMYETKSDYYGLNVESMTIYSDKDIGVKEITSIRAVDLIQENGKIYYQMTMTLSKFTTQGDLKFWNEINGNNIYFNFESFVTDENGLTTARINVTNQATSDDPISPHMSVGGVNFINNSNIKGDILNPSNNKIDYEETLIQANGKSYLLHNYWEMPALLIVSQNYIKIKEADLFLENNRVYYTLTYRVIGYDLDSVQFFDGNTIYASTISKGDACYVTFKIDATDLGAVWPHLRVNNTEWDSVSNTKSEDGNVYLNVTEKKVTYNGKTYTLKTEWDMPAMTVS